MSGNDFHHGTEAVGVRNGTGRHCLRAFGPRAAVAPPAIALGALLGFGTPPGGADGRVALAELEARLSPLPPAPRTEPTASDITLVWYDPERALPAGLDVMTREVQAIFRDLGVRVSWRDGGGGTFGEGPTPELAVILLAEDPVRERARARVLGLILKKQGPNRSIWLFLSNVRWTLGLDPRPRVAAPDGEWRDVGLALGRVLAHELVHSIVPDEPHAEGGLMRHSLDRGYLLGKRVSVHRRCARALLARLGIAESAAERRERAAVFAP